MKCFRYWEPKVKKKQKYCLTFLILYNYTRIYIKTNKRYKKRMKQKIRNEAIIWCPGEGKFNSLSKHSMTFLNHSSIVNRNYLCSAVMCILHSPFCISIIESNKITNELSLHRIWLFTRYHSKASKKILNKFWSEMSQHTMYVFVRFYLLMCVYWRWGEFHTKK